MRQQVRLLAAAVRRCFHSATRAAGTLHNLAVGDPVTQEQIVACDAVPVVLAMTAVSSDAASKAASLLWVLATNSNNHPRLVQVARWLAKCVCGC